MDVKKKIGPLPAYAWALILGGTIGVVLLVKKGKATTGTTGEVIPELAAQATPSSGGGEGGGGAAGSLEAAEAKDSAELEALRNQITAQAPANGTGSSGGLGAGIGEVIEAREALEALGLSVGNPQHNTEESSSGKSAVKKATGKGAANPLTSQRGKYHTGTFKGHAAHIYATAVHGGVGPKKNIVVLGGPAKVTHAAAGSHVPAHVSKPPAHHTAAKPAAKAPAKRPAPASHPAAHAAPAPVHHAAPAPKPPPRKPPPPPPRKRR